MSEDKKFRYIGGQAWVEMDEPNDMDYSAFDEDDWDKDMQAYNNRLHFDVVPQPKEWEESRLIIEGVDFTWLNKPVRGELTTFVVPINKLTKDDFDKIEESLIVETNEYAKKYIQPTMKEERAEGSNVGVTYEMKEERKFTLDEMLEVWNDSRLFQENTYGHSFQYKSPVNYFKEKFNIDL